MFGIWKNPIKNSDNDVKKLISECIKHLNIIYEFIKKFLIDNYYK